jgi:hypothetical protein
VHLKALVAVALRACLEGGRSHLAPAPAPLLLFLPRSHLCWMLAVDQEGEGEAVSEGVLDGLCGLQYAWLRRRTTGVEWCPRQQSCPMSSGGGRRKRRRRMAPRAALLAPVPEPQGQVYGQGQDRALLA